VIAATIRLRPLAKDQSTAESTERNEVYKALRNADTAATTAQRELAIRNSVVSIQSGGGTPESEALRICCSTYEFALKYSHPSAILVRILNLRRSPARLSSERRIAPELSTSRTAKENSRIEHS
jgi:hypothetical protein